MPSPAALFGFDPPDLDANEALAIAAEYWGVTGEPHRLHGERPSGPRWCRRRRDGRLPRRAPVGRPRDRGAPRVVLTRTALTLLLAEYQIRHAPHLVPGAAAHLPHVVERLVRWSRLDAGAMTDRIHRTIEAALASPTDASSTEAAP